MVSENRFCISQQKVEDKSNEITEFIRHKGGHYFLALKEKSEELV
jgi:hypothetical protein